MSRTRLTSRIVLLLSLAVIAACGDDSDGSSAGADAGVTDVGASDADAGTVDAGDTGATDASADAGPPPEFEGFESPPVEASSELTPLDAEWLIGVPDDRATTDATYDDLESGAFFFPFEGTDADRVVWSAWEPAEDGVVPDPPFGTLYVAARFTVDQPTTIVVQGDRAFRLWLDGRRNPGDIYANGRTRVPWRVEAGEHWLVMQATGQRGAPRMRAWTTPDPIVFNTADRTWPHLVVGSSEPMYLGVAVMNGSRDALTPVRAVTVENEHFEAAVVELPALPPEGVTQVPFSLVPKQPWAEIEEVGEGEEPARIPVTVRIEAANADASYEATIELERRDPTQVHRVTRQSSVDGSVQYYAVRPTTDPSPDDSRALVLSLHGAAVEAQGQAGAYSTHDDVTIIAPTNRRPFGFDWEAWGRLDALEALDHAAARIAHDPERVHVTGHSMGGHGTWQMSTLFPGRFASAGPSAGWASFYTYTGEARPQGAFARSQASSDTNAYLTNLARRSVFIVHGDADDNVPVREARDLFAEVSDISDDVGYHEQPGAGHWWNGDAAPGTDCLEWPGLWERILDRRLDLTELDFDFVTPGPFVSPSHQWATILAVDTPMSDARLTATSDGDTVTLTTDNVRTLEIDTMALQDAGVSALTVDGESVELGGERVVVGPIDGKQPGQQGPFNEVYASPWCWVYEAAGPDVYRDLAGWLASNWAVIGNGYGCALALEQVTPWVEANYALVYLGLPPQNLEFDVDNPFELAGSSIRIEDRSYDGAAVAYALPRRGRLAANIVATDGNEHLLFRIMPFTSRFALPDFLVWSDAGGEAGGFFDAMWALDPALGFGL